MLDEPQALPETHGFATSGWNAVPTGGKVIARIAPLLGIEPRFDLPPADSLILAASRQAVMARHAPRLRRIRAIAFGTRIARHRAATGWHETSRPLQRLTPRSSRAPARSRSAGVTADSRAVKPGDLFVALPGTKADGARFVDAGDRGGRGGDRRRAMPPDAAAACRSSQPTIARRALALAAARFYPRQPQTIAAVTGTSGKTSVAAFTRQIWAALGHAGRQHRHHRRRDAEAAKSTAR